jgi:hypothetical protein
MLGRFAPGIRRADGPGQVTGDIRGQENVYLIPLRYRYYTLTEFEYDQNKSEHNHAKLGLDFEQAQVLWNDPKRVEFVARFSDEPRLDLVG